MLLEIPCPKCQAKLRSPTDIRGKTVRCKKCNEKFKVPLADEPVTDPGLSTGDTQQLSVIDTEMLVAKAKPASAPIAVAKILRVEAEPIILDDGMDVVAKAAPLPLPLPPPAPAISAFDFDEQENLRKKKKKKRDDDDDDDDRPRRKRRDDDDDEEEALVRPKYTGTKGSKLPMIMTIGVGVCALLAVVVVGILFLTGVIGKKEVAKATTAPSLNTPTTSTSKTSSTGTGSTKITPATSNPTFPITPNTGPTPKPTVKTPPTGKGPGPAPGAQAKLPTIPPATPELTARIKSSATIDMPAEKIIAVRWGNKGTYNVIFTAFRDSDGFRGEGASDTIVSYNADTGEKIGTMKVKADKCKWPRAFEASPNGRYAAIEGPAGKLTVYDFDESKFVLEGADVNVGMANRGNAIVGLVFTDDDKLVVVDSHGSTDDWSMTTKQPVQRMPNLPGAEEKKIRAVTRLGTTGKVLLLARDGELLMNERQVTALSNPSGYSPIFVAGDTTGKQAAVLSKDPNSTQHELTVFTDLTKQGRQQKVTLPPEVGEITGMAWQSIYSIVITIEGGKASLIVDIDPEVAVPTLAFYIKAPDGKTRPFDRGPFQYFYYAISDGKGSKFISLNIDFDDYLKLRNNAKDTKPQTPVYLIPSDRGFSK